MGELRAQLDRGEQKAPADGFDAVVVACGSGGTAAGTALGAARSQVARRTIAIAVCDDSAYFERVTARLLDEARALLGLTPGALPAPLEIEDRFKGPAYGIASADQLRFIAQVARETGLILDPVYTGKALFGLSRLEPKPRRVLFVHTGGLPGLLAQGEDLWNAAQALGSRIEPM
jgi:D-cysteine desulfhydrase